MEQNERIIKKSLKNFIIFLGIACFILGNNFNNYIVVSKTSRELEKFRLAYQYIMDEWYFGIDDDNLSEDLINNAIQSLINNNIDPHSHYSITSGSTDDSYSRGYGMSIIYYNHYTRIVKIQPNSPISKVLSNGIKIEEGDYLVEVNGITTYHKPISEVTTYFKSNHIQGEKDIFKIRKSDNTEYSFDIVAGSYEVETALGKTIDSIGLLTISSFELNTPSKSKVILDNFVNDGIRNLIIDLRDNPGGFVDSVVEIVDWFLPKGTTIVTFTKKDGSKEVIKSNNGVRYNFSEVLVLTNGNSASASELLTGALVDNNVAHSAGSKTYGKGSAQKTIRLGIDGGQLTYTYALWTTSPARVIHNVGIEPDLDYQYIPHGLFENSLSSLDYDEKYYLGDQSSKVEKANIILGLLGYEIDLGNEITSKNILAYNQFKEDNALVSNDKYDYEIYMKLADKLYDSYILGQNSIIEFAIGKIND